jgi:hypothetical protein
MVVTEAPIVLRGTWALSQCFLSASDSAVAFVPPLRVTSAERFATCSDHGLVTDCFDVMTK